jgi:acyl-CoA synthetase (AMP-forming)/AMP-acid ligase II
LVPKHGFRDFARNDVGGRNSPLEICVQGPNLFDGYVSNGNAGLQIGDGWLHTGDLGVRTTDGGIAFAGYAKNMFTHNGFNIYPKEIELAVRELPGVESVVCSPSDAADTLDPEIVLDVVGNVDEAAVRHWCAERLAAYKQPAVIRCSLSSGSYGQ